MKILFLHLSDSHFREDTKFSDININAIVNSLQDMGDFDECVLVFSGDIVQSGEINQYKTAGNFIGTLVNRIKQGFLIGARIPTLIVPGNHDNLVGNSSRNLDEIKGYYLSGKVDEYFYSDLRQLKNFYDFANRNRCYNKRKVIEIRTLEYEKFKIKINLINSAPFSLLCDGNEDKGQHYFPKKELNKLDIEKGENYTISIIHHSPEWFEDNTKKVLYNKLNASSDLIFVGHEHFPLSESKIVNGVNHVDTVNGVALYGTNAEQGFNALILDTEYRCLKGKKFIYNGTKYISSKNLERENIIFKGKYKFTGTSEFMRFLNADIDERDGDCYPDYFVFPTLQAKNMNDDMKNYRVLSEDSFIQLIKNKNKILIEGGNKSGKTILSKYLCKLFLNEYVVVYLTEESFSLKDNNKIIKYALREQYGDETSEEDFWNLESSKRLLIIDNYNQIPKERWQSFWNEVKDKFQYLILFSGIDWNINLKEKTIEDLSEDKMFYLSISPFYYVKREELIKKICSTHQERPILDLDIKVKKINDEIKNQIKHFQLTPDFIHRFVEYCLSDLYTATGKETNIFSKVFEANITARLSKNADQNSVEELLIALDHVAYYIHSIRQYQLSYEQFSEAIQNYNKKYDNNLNVGFVRNVAIEAKIIKEVSDNDIKLEFCDTNLLAYFIALYLNRALGEGEGIDELQNILDNICFRPNGDIVMFLSYITSNIKILLPIKDSLVKHMSSWDELDFDLNNIKYLSKVQFVETPKLPGKREREEVKRYRDDIEQEVIENRDSDIESLYSYDEAQVNSFGNKVLKGISYLELVAKILPNFRHILRGEQKKEIVEILYQYPNKLLYFMLKDIDKNYDRIIDEIVESIPKTKEGKIITKGMIMKSFQAQSVGYILSVYDFVAGIVTSNGKTVADLNKTDYFNYGGKTANILQNIMIEENVGNFYNMAAKAEKLLKRTNVKIVEQMLRLIVRKYFLCHEIQIVGEVQRVASVFLGTNKETIKELQMIQAKNATLKK